MEEIKVIIQDTLGMLEETQVSAVLQNLKDIGVDSIEDLEFLTETDLLVSLKPIQARKLLKVFKVNKVSTGTQTTIEVPAVNLSTPNQLQPTSTVTTVEVSTGTETTIEVPAVNLSIPNQLQLTSTVSTGTETTIEVPAVNLSTPNQLPVADGQSIVPEIIWKELPGDILAELEKKKFLEPGYYRRELVRLIIDNILQTNPNPKRQIIMKVGKIWVAMYPHSLKKDTTDDSFIKQLCSRVENMKRSPKAIKRSAADLDPPGSLKTIKMDSDNPTGVDTKKEEENPFEETKTAVACIENKENCALCSLLVEPEAKDQISFSTSKLEIDKPSQPNEPAESVPAVSSSQIESVKKKRGRKPGNKRAPRKLKPRFPKFNFKQRKFSPTLKRPDLYPNLIFFNDEDDSQYLRNTSRDVMLSSTLPFQESPEYQELKETYQRLYEPRIRVRYASLPLNLVYNKPASFDNKQKFQHLYV